MLALISCVLILLNASIGDSVKYETLSGSKTKATFRDIKSIKGPITDPLKTIQIDPKAPNKHKTKKKSSSHYNVVKVLATGDQSILTFNKKEEQMDALMVEANKVKPKNGIKFASTAPKKQRRLIDNRQHVNAFPYIGQISFLDSVGTPTPHCTGWAISPRHVVSAGHCAKTPGLPQNPIGIFDFYLGLDGAPNHLTPPPIKFDATYFPEEWFNADGDDFDDASASSWDVLFDLEIFQHDWVIFHTTTVMNTYARFAVAHHQNQHFGRCGYPGDHPWGFYCAACAFVRLHVVDGRRLEALIEFSDYAYSGESGSPIAYSYQNVQYGAGILSFKVGSVRGVGGNGYVGAAIRTRTYLRMCHIIDLDIVLPRGQKWCPDFDQVDKKEFWLSYKPQKKGPDDDKDNDEDDKKHKNPKHQSHGDQTTNKAVFARSEYLNRYNDAINDQHVNKERAMTFHGDYRADNYNKNYIALDALYGIDIIVVLLTLIGVCLICMVFCCVSGIGVGIVTNVFVKKMVLSNQNKYEPIFVDPEL